MRNQQDNLLFNDAFFRDLLERMKQGLREEIGNLNRDRLLNTPEDDLVEYFINRYSSSVPELHDENRHALPPRDIKFDVRGRHDYAAFDDEPVLAKGTSITVVIPFEGDGQYFSFRPATYSLKGIRGNIIKNEIHLTYSGLPQDMSPDSLKQKLERDITQIKQYLQRMSEEADEHNRFVKEQVRGLLAARRNEILKDESLVQSLGIPIKRRADDAATYRIPVKRKEPAIIRPKGKKNRLLEPILDAKEYEHILDLISRMALVMERSPRAFYEMDEESIRWQFLVPLNSHYEGMASGETFNYKGKTDILIRYEDRNVFIAECKIWQGPKLFIETIDQILKYTSWRDTKTAIVLFNKNENFSAVLSQIPGLVKSHPNCLRELKQRGETSFQFVLHHPTDKTRELILTVLAFDVPRKK